MSRLKLFIPLAIFTAMAGLLYAGLGLDPENLPSALIGKPVPEFSLAALDDPERKITAEDMRGKPYLINVWATWCPTCAQEHPYLLHLAEMGIPIYGVNWRDDRALALRLLERTGNPYQDNIYDPEGHLAMALGVFGSPETFVVDGDGIIRHKVVGMVTERVWASEMSYYFFRD